ncbi:YlbF family regulator [Paenibacillus ginsengarvi]|uniref:YlbF family regulator n=1 Tax=Paenibacillus ginsengarvi TaxID=400777 RepID=A0A3B0CY53_9BACL|nr:YlbF family regulator [Paenibacillus ginsengarvi]RKN86656.1 YlbF family regulator [Paenibacillus ginsengarvi]
MSVTEAHALDMTGILMQAYEVGEMINSSAEVANYIKWKNAVERDSEIQVAVAAFAKAKMMFEECERFGHFHPDYHAALDVVNKAEQRLDSFESVRQFKEAETRLDDLLFTVSKTIAHSVSDSIKVPSNNPLPTNGCGSGGCSGGCSSCG